MKPFIYASCAVMFISGVWVAGGEVLFPPIPTVIFAVSAVVSIWGLLAINRKEGRE